MDEQGGGFSSSPGTYWSGTLQTGLKAAETCASWTSSTSPQRGFLGLCGTSSTDVLLVGNGASPASPALWTRFTGGMLTAPQAIGIDLANGCSAESSQRLWVTGTARVAGLEAVRTVVAVGEFIYVGGRQSGRRPGIVRLAPQEAARGSRQRFATWPSSP